jgi:hypothetical protein
MYSGLDSYERPATRSGPPHKRKYMHAYNAWHGMAVINKHETSVRNIGLECLFVGTKRYLSVW